MSNQKKLTPEELTSYRLELAKLAAASQTEVQALSREIKRQQNVLAAAAGMARHTEDQIKTEQAGLNELEAASRRAMRELALAKDQCDRAMAAYNEKLEEVKNLHDRLDEEQTELLRQQEQAKSVLTRWQQQNFFHQKQQAVLAQIAAEDTDKLPELSDLKPKEQPAGGGTASGRPHANADFWNKEQHATLKLRPAADDEEDEEAAEAQKPSTAKTIFSYLMCIAAAALLALVIRTWVLLPTEVSGTSMQPTLEPHDRLLTSPLPYLWGEPQRGDIIVFHPPHESGDALFVKRVIGLPGEHVLIENGEIFIDDKKLDEPYLPDDYTAGYVDTVVPERTVFVLGDNRNVSHDSRDSDVACIGYDEIQGEALWRIYPFESFGRVE